ncbi:MAG: peptidoglycan DD-metalloendopeptidase family protein, partial [Arenicellales bacterium]
KSKMSYRVKGGDTLHLISFRTGIAYQKLAEWNEIASPYKIYVGDELSLRAPLKRIKKPTQTAKVKAGKTTKKRPVKTNSKLASKPIKIAKLPKSVSKWQWPAAGKLVQTYSKNKAQYGIKIAAKRNSAVRSAAAGQVVYAGDGIKGYGELVIVKHSEKFISAYAHNNAILVKEGERVTAGQPVAKMGSTGTRGVKLHFEIRKNGNPVNPLKYLPLKRG